MWFSRRCLFLICSAVCLLVVWQISMEFSSQIMNLSCTRIDHVVFLKTHKTAGSSIQNMLMRYGMSRNLTFLIPLVDNYFGHPTKFAPEMVTKKLKPNFHYQIFTHHTRYSWEGLSRVMPLDSVYFTVLRDPVTLFESAYSYTHLDRELNMSLQTFVMSNDTGHSEKRNRRGSGGKIGRNQMAFDLGYEVEDFEDLYKAELFARRLENEFRLVMIAERLPESLVLLKDILCWSTDDIVIFRHNARKQEFKKPITPELKAGILRWNQVDQYIYQYFSAVFDRKVENFGRERMRLELSALEQATAKWYDACVQGTGGKSDLQGKNKVWSDQVLGFKPKDNSNQICQDLIKSENHFTVDIQRYMLNRYERPLWAF